MQRCRAWPRFGGEADRALPARLARLFDRAGVDWVVDVSGSSPSALAAALRRHWSIQEVAEDLPTALAFALGASAGGRRPLALTAAAGLADAVPALQAVLQAQSPMLLAVHAGPNGGLEPQALGAAVGLLRGLQLPLIAIEPCLRDQHYAALARQALDERRVAALLLPEGV